MTRELLLLVNPHAGGVEGPDHADAVRRELAALGARVEMRVTETLDELRASFAPEDCERRIAVLGGDGSVHAAVNHLPCARHELALLPTGTANNIARSLGLPTDLGDAARLAVSGRPRLVDRVVATGERGRQTVVEGVSAGLHSLARTRYEGENSSGIGSAVAAAASALRDFREPSIRVASDGGDVEEPMTQLFVANLPRYGFALRVAPGADPSDGRVDVVAIRPASRLEALAMPIRLRRGTHLGRRGVRRWRASRLRIDTHRHVPVVADTRDLGAGPVELEVERGALAIVAPAG